MIVTIWLVNDADVIAAVILSLFMSAGSLPPYEEKWLFANGFVALAVDKGAGGPPQLEPTKRAFSALRAYQRRLE